MRAICREVDRGTGKVAVYPLKCEVTNHLLAHLHIRSCMNPELRYFVMPDNRWEAFSDVILKTLKRKTVTTRMIEEIGGVVEL